jgi:LysW-gamma-L-lysine carboxypeptidase
MGDYEVTSTRAVLMRKCGTGDINAFANTIKRPMIAYGPGNSHLDHAANEHVKIQEYLDAIQVLQEALNKLALVDSKKVPRGSHLLK